MDAIVGESYVSRTHTDRNTPMNEASSSDRNSRINPKPNKRRQPETTYGVSFIHVLANETEKCQK